MLATRIELVKQYMAFQSEQKLDELLALLAEDVTMSSPMSGTITGKEALAEQMRNRPMGGGGNSPMGNVTWSDPEEEGEDVKVLGTGGSFGTLKILLSFNSDDEINKIVAGLA